MMSGVVMKGEFDVMSEVVVNGELDVMSGVVEIGELDVTNPKRILTKDAGSEFYFSD